MDKNDFNISYSWTQPYLPTSYNPFYQTSEPKNALTLQEELDRLAEIDDQVSLMHSYPEAQAIIQKVQNGL